MRTKPRAIRAKSVIPAAAMMSSQHCRDLHDGKSPINYPAVSIIEPVVISKLICCVKKHGCIYDPRHPQHTTRTAVNSAWRQIAAELNLPETQCREKWANLRSNYARELRKTRRKVAELLPDLTSNRKPHSQWIFYDAMSFLAPFVKSRLATFETVCDTDEQPSIAGCIVKLEEEGSRSSCGEGTSEDKWCNRMETSGSARAAADCLEMLEEDDDRLFLLSLLPKMRYLSMRDNIKFRIEVQSLLLDKLSTYPQDPLAWTAETVLPTQSDVPFSLIAQPSAQREDNP